MAATQLRAPRLTLLGSIVVAIIIAVAATFDVLATQYATLFAATQRLDELKGALPVGTIVAYGGPMSDKDRARLKGQGWLVCDGTNWVEEEKLNLAQSLGAHVFPLAKTLDFPALVGFVGQFVDLNAAAPKIA